MYKKFFTVLFAVGLLFAFTGMSMACGGYHDKVIVSTTNYDNYNNYMSLNPDAYAGGQFTGDHGSSGGNAESEAFADGYKDKETVTETTRQTWRQDYSGWGWYSDWYKVGEPLTSSSSEFFSDSVSAEADAFVTGYTNGGDNLYSGSGWKIGDSWGHSDVYGSAWAMGDPGFDGSADTFAHVDGYANQWNGINFGVGNGNNGAGVSGGNYTYGDFDGDMYGNEYASISGGASAFGDTFGEAVVVPGSFAAAGAITYGSSYAWQSGYGDTSVFGEGGVSHGTWLSGSNFNAGTSGNAGFTYSGDGAGYASGSGMASTYGTVNVGSNGFTAHSHSYANGGYGGCGVE